MILKRTLVAFIVAVPAGGCAMAQEPPEGWASEFIARDAGGDGVIDGAAFAGVAEDAVFFPPGFFEPGSERFWSYVMLWRGSRRLGLTQGRLEAMLVDYYDRLADLTGGAPGATARISREDDRFQGAVILEDMFAGAGTLALNVRAREVACAEDRFETVVTVAANRALSLPGGLLHGAAEELQCAKRNANDG